MEDMSGRFVGHDAPEFEQFYALIRERQGIIEGVVDRMRGELVQVQGM